VEIRRQRISGNKKMGNIRKLAICLLIGVVVAFVLRRIIYRIIWEFGNQHIPPQVYAIAGLVVVVMAAVIFRRRVLARRDVAVSGVRERFTTGEAGSGSGRRMADHGNCGKG
jgi:hypothetical protein